MNTEAQTTKASDTQVGGSHYKDMDIQPWDVIDTWPLEQRIGFYRGNAMKYLMRMGAKDERATEAGKAGHYLQKLVEVLGEADAAEERARMLAILQSGALDQTPRNSRTADPDIGATICCGNTATCTKPCVHRLLAGADADGWMNWPGGECPVPAGTPVDVQLRNGHKHSGRALEDEAVAWDLWHVGVPDNPSPHESDIVRFRIVTP